MISLLKFNSPYLIKMVFESSKDSGSLNDCLVTVDGTDVRIPQQGLAIPGTIFLRSSLKGNVHSGMRLGWIFLPAILYVVWFNGPYTAGKYPDIKIFCSGVAHWLDEFERVEADNGYIGEVSQKVKCPGCALNPTKN